MNAFIEKRRIEALGMERLLPYIEDKAFKGRMVVTTKGALSKFLQESVGDVIFNVDEHTICCVEIKVEREWTDNLFLETWSNRNLENRKEHADLGSNPGWLWKIRADALLYYFLDTDQLVVVPVFSLKRWAFVKESIHSSRPGRLWDFPEKPTKVEQKNDAWGRLVPVKVLTREAGAKLITVQQLSLFGME